MKVGTDGVLLGAWVTLDKNADSILDIGAGTGLIALMLAQRSDAETVDAVEIDKDAYEQCVENFENSPWGDRLFCYHAGLDEFVDEWEDTYDLIVCNPPFHEPGPPLPLASPPKGETSTGSSREKARFYNFLPFDKLVEGVVKLLSENGTFAVIIPFKEEEKILALASKIGLRPQKITRVKGNTTAKIKRSLLQLGFGKTQVKFDELTIELERHQYTEDYKNLTGNFYLKM